MEQKEQFEAMAIYAAHIRPFADWYRIEGLLFPIEKKRATFKSI